MKQARGPCPRSRSLPRSWGVLAAVVRKGSPIRPISCGGESPDRRRRSGAAPRSRSRRAKPRPRCGRNPPRSARVAQNRGSPPAGVRSRAGPRARRVGRVTMRTVLPRLAWGSAASCTTASSGACLRWRVVLSGPAHGPQDVAVSGPPAAGSGPHRPSARDRRSRPSARRETSLIVASGCSQLMGGRPPPLPPRSVSFCSWARAELAWPAAGLAHGVHLVRDLPGIERQERPPPTTSAIPEPEAEQKGQLQGHAVGVEDGQVVPALKCHDGDREQPP